MSRKPLPPRSGILSATFLSFLFLTPSCLLTMWLVLLPVFVDPTHGYRSDGFTSLGSLDIDDAWGLVRPRRRLATSNVHIVDLSKTMSSIEVGKGTSTDDSLTEPTRHSISIHIEPAVSKRVLQNSRQRSSDQKSKKSSTPSEGQSQMKNAVAEVSLPLIPTPAFESMQGNEFDNPSTIDDLARTGLMMTTQIGNGNEWIDWKPHKDTERLLADKGEQMALDDGDVLVYLGKAKKQDGFFGSHLPIIKTKSIIPLGAEEMAELLLDSSRVKIYNKLSLGRDDIKVYNANTKIVRNLTKPPVAKSNMVSVTLMHSRKLSEDDQTFLKGPHKGGYLCVSRAVPGADDKYTDIPRNDILLGVNLLQETGPNECIMTAVTHVYSPSLPSILASRLGVSSAINFVKDIRGSCQPVGS